MRRIISDAPVIVEFTSDEAAEMRRLLDKSAPSYFTWLDGDDIRKFDDLIYNLFKCLK